MAEEQVDVRSEMAVFQAQRAKVDAFVVLQELPRSFDGMLESLTETAISLKKGTVSSDEATKALAEIIRGDIPQLRIKLMGQIQTALERMDEVNNSLANELVEMQIKFGSETKENES